jgi:hypothetical protein
VKQNGITAQPNKLKKRVKMGEITKAKVFALVGITVSFINNFKPSAKGCSKPQKPTKVGPCRC